MDPINELERSDTKEGTGTARALGVQDLLEVRLLAPRAPRFVGNPLNKLASCAHRYCRLVAIAYAFKTVLYQIEMKWLREDELSVWWVPATHAAMPCRWT